jgi:hypothetical protein
VSKDYDVGYGKPPKSGRFRKGESGNQKGRPKGHKNLKTELLEELAERIQIREDGERRQISKQRAIIKQLVAKAIKGDPKAASAIFQFVQRLVGEQEPASEPTLTPVDEEILAAFLKRSSGRKKKEHHDG